MMTMTDADDLMSYDDIAIMTSLSPGTLRGYRAAGRMPEPDELPAHDRPRWRRSTITAWLAERPGRGRPLKHRPHEFVRRDNADGGSADRACVECGLNDDNAVHTSPKARGAHA
jgi:hypothetical protein